MGMPVRRSLADDLGVGQVTIDVSIVEASHGTSLTTMFGRLSRVRAFSSGRPSHLDWYAPTVTLSNSLRSLDLSDFHSMALTLVVVRNTLLLVVYWQVV